MMSHVSLTCISLSVLMSIVSSQMMVHYPMDMGNYVDYRQDLAGDLLKHRYEYASNLYSDNIYPASIGLPGHGLGLVRDPLFGGPLFNDPLMLGVPRQTVYVRSPVNTVATGQVVQQPAPRVQTVSTQPKVTWIRLTPQNSLTVEPTRGVSAIMNVPKTTKSTSQLADRSQQTTATMDKTMATTNFIGRKTATETAPKKIGLMKNILQKNSPKKIIPNENILKKNIPKKTVLKKNISRKPVPRKSVPQTTAPRVVLKKQTKIIRTTEATNRRTLQRGAARQGRPQLYNQSKVNTIRNDFSNRRRSFQGGSSTQNRAQRRTRLQLLRVPSQNNRRVSQRA